jgi:hypothetical protein
VRHDFVVIEEVVVGEVFIEMLEFVEHDFVDVLDVGEEGFFVF